jgi:predicted ATP-grasp superfamily ATP-dependent carboligase
MTQQNEIRYILTIDRLQMLEISKQQLLTKARELAKQIGKTPEQFQKDLAAVGINQHLQATKEANKAR